MAGVEGKAERDLRLDFFRGLALLFIFLNHIPGNVVSWISNRNYGFSDATEIFVFISGYSVMLAFGALPERVGWTVTAARIGRRVWQIYTAHIFLFMVFVAHIAYVADRFNPAFAEEMGIAELFEHPHILMLQALLLKFKPANMDVLPMYIALLLVFPLLLPLLKRWPKTLMAASFLLWLGVQQWHWNLPAYPEGGWFFNPLAWQFLFLIGAWCAMHRNAAPWRRLPAGLTSWAAGLYLLFAFAIVCTWLYPPWSQYVPHWLRRLLYPIDKTELDLLRLLHFLAQAYLVVRLVSPHAAFLSSRLARPVLLCGKHSLDVFCASIFLSFAAQFVLVEISPSLPAQFLVSLVGMGMMVALAYLLTWYTDTEKAGSAPRGGKTRVPAGGD
ncbi:MAG: OpgC domain-containing protein [Ferrovibrio sp.]|jgi:hypothetical protein|nr:OpgC domain-containing protein [Ferrovibrio sp.]